MGGGGRAEVREGDERGEGMVPNQLAHFNNPLCMFDERRGRKRNKTNCAQPRSNLGVESNPLLLLLLGEVEPLKDGEHLFYSLVRVPEVDCWDPGTRVDEYPLFDLPVINFF